LTKITSLTGMTQFSMPIELLLIANSTSSTWLTTFKILFLTLDIVDGTLSLILLVICTKTLTEFPKTADLNKLPGNSWLTMSLQWWFKLVCHWPDLRHAWITFTQHQNPLNGTFKSGAPWVKLISLRLPMKDLTWIEQFKKLVSVWLCHNGEKTTMKIMTSVLSMLLTSSTEKLRLIPNTLHLNQKVPTRHLIWVDLLQTSSLS
jgi:hypothetical protein